jgi:hypothetical protein
LWHLVIVLPDTARSAVAPKEWLYNLLALVRLLAGLTIGLVMLFALAERTGGRLPDRGLRSLTLHASWSGHEGVRCRRHRCDRRAVAALVRAGHQVTAIARSAEKSAL